MSTAATREEQAELHVLRDQADRTAAEAARTLAEMSRRVSVARRQPGEAARRLSAGARGTLLRAVREGPGMIAGQRGAKRLALAAIPVLAVAAALAYAAVQRKPAAATVKSLAQERIRLPARRSIPLVSRPTS